MVGLVPLALTDPVWEGLCLAIVFGISLATVLTMLVIPAIYLVFRGRPTAFPTRTTRIPQRRLPMPKLLVSLFALIGALLALTVATPSFAADLSGTWSLDKSASDSPDAFLKAQGVSWIKRKAAAGMDVVLNITQDGNAVTIETVTSAQTKKETIQVDGETRTVEGDKGAARVQHQWKSDTLVTTMNTSGKQEATIVTVRALSDDGMTLTQSVTMTKADGTMVTMRRVFRKS